MSTVTTHLTISRALEILNREPRWRDRAESRYRHSRSLVRRAPSVSASSLAHTISGMNSTGAAHEAKPQRMSAVDANVER